LVALFAQRSALGRADFRHQYFAAYLIAPLIVALGVRGWRALRRTAPTARDLTLRLTLACSGLVFMFIALWVPDLLTDKLNLVTKYRSRMWGINYWDPQGDSVRRRVEAVGYLVGVAVPKSAPVFDFSNQPAFYYFLNRPNPTRFYQIPIASPAAFEREVIADLEKAKPRIILRGSPERYDRFDEIPNDTRAPIIARYIDTRYELWRIAAGVELWKRRPSTSPPTAAELSAPLTLPKGIARDADERLIFPALGSLTGAGLAEWRADLTIYNGSKVPVELTLRYDADTLPAQRRIAIAPFRTVVLRDAPAKFFGRPQSRGSLQITYPEGRKPVVMLQSYDARRPESLTTEAPLSSFQVAQAKTQLHALAIVGAVQSQERRVNLGVMNSGEGAARVKIVCRTRTGDVVGEPLFRTLEEGTNFNIVDASTALGATLDGTTTIHVDVLQGTAAAYASVVDIATGSHYSISGVPSDYR
jgi:hypothetical protein